MIKYESNGDVRVEGDTAEAVEREMNTLQMFAASRDQRYYFIGPRPMIGGGHAAMGKLSTILSGHLKD